MLRILAGIYKGRLLKTPKGDVARPTTGLVRGAVFDIAQSLISDARFLDLFAGSGAMGIEALSRGASHVAFIEKDRGATRTIEENLRALTIDKAQAALLTGDALAVLKRLSKASKQFDIIYIDPPYNRAAHLLPEILLLIDASSLLSTHGLLFVEQGAHAPFSLSALALKHLHLMSERRYGMSYLSCFARSVPKLKK